jgi:N-acyl-D-aspartate/D-glutamate deacylase
VVAGNCGFTVAPVAPGDGDFIIQMLARVEGMPAEALREGLSWDWESFGEYLERLRQRVAVNYLAQVGHSSLRRYAMGDAAFERSATANEVGAMHRCLRQALQAGARGFTTSTSPTHHDSFGRPVPSRLAERNEFIALASALDDTPHPLIGISPGSKFVGINAEERSMMIEMAVVSGALVHWNPLVYSDAYPDLHTRTLELSAEARAAGGRVVGVYNPGPPGPTRVDLRSGFLFESLPHWKEVLRLSVDERCQAFTDPEVRRGLRADFEDDTRMGHLTARLRKMWPVLTIATVSSPENEKYLGRTVGVIAAEEGSDPLDTMLDLAVRDRLDTVFMNDDAAPSDPAANEAMLTLAHHDDVVFGGSDAGAHLDFMSNEPLPSRALALRVREQGLLSLEEVVRGFTGRLAETFGLAGRGVLVPGAAADVCVFDLDQIGAEMPHMVDDLPARSVRFVTEPRGIYQTIVNGVVVSEEGHSTGALPGQLL